MFSLYHNPDLDNRIFDCLLTSMAAIQAEDVGASSFMSASNGNHQEWFGSTTTNRHGVEAFAASSTPSTGCCCSTNW